MDKKQPQDAMRGQPAFLFDLDGTLIDSVYQHILAWREASEQMGAELSNWRIHRRVGMSDGLIGHAFTRETGRQFKFRRAGHSTGSCLATIMPLVFRE
jgi:beta-phosphoglucomutase-like phosphatase (HAD superfamily)